MRGHLHTQAYMHAAKTKSHLLRMNRQHHAHIDVISMHLKIACHSWFVSYRGCHVQAVKSQLLELQL